MMALYVFIGLMVLYSAARYIENQHRNEKGMS